MSDTTTEDNPSGQPLGLPLNDQLGQASVAPGPTGYSIEAVKVCVEGAYKAGQAAERESSHAEFRVQNKCIADQHDEIARLRAALTLAANRLDVLALDHEYGTTLRNVTEDWAKETRAALGPNVL